MNATTEMELAPEGRLVLYVEELVTKLGVSNDTVREAIHRGEVKASKFGRRLVIPLAEVRRILSPLAGKPTVVA